MSNAQRRAHADLLPVYGVPFSPVAFDLDRVFGRAAPRILEIGFGMGETTATIAQQHPENDYLGVEVHTPGVGSLLKRIDELHLENVRVIQHDAVEVLRHMIPSAALDGVHVFFPDPWLINTASGFAGAGSRPETKFETRGLRLGHRVWDLVFRKSSAPR